MRTYTIIVTGCLLILCFSCKKEKALVSKQELQHRIDSILAVRIKEIENDAAKDLELRKTIELKVKSDSIYNSRRVQDSLTRVTKTK